MSLLTLYLLYRYMFDVIYVTWFVHVMTALVWTRFWYLYLYAPFAPYLVMLPSPSSWFETY